jgi:hypothetical protein
MLNVYIILYIMTRADSYYILSTPFSISGAAIYFIGASAAVNGAFYMR